MKLRGYVLPAVNVDTVIKYGIPQKIYISHNAYQETLRTRGVSRFCVLRFQDSRELPQSPFLLFESFS